MSPKRIGMLVIGLLYAIFVIQNAHVVQVRFLFWSTTVSRSLVLVGTFVLGFIAGRLWGWIQRKKV